MIVFWLVSGGMVLVALAVLARPLLRAPASGPAEDRQTENVRIARERMAELREELRIGALDQEAFESARTDLETLLAVDLDAGDAPVRTRPTGRWIGVIALAVVPVLAVYLYVTLGSPEAIDGTAVAELPQDHPETAQEQELPSVDQMITRLLARLEQQPDDARGWYMLGRSYLALGRYQDAADAFERTQALVGDEPDVLIAYADALAMLQGGRLRGEPMALVERALAREPDSPTALWLAGMGYRETGDLDKAIQHWQRARDLMPPESEARGDLQGLIEQARADGGRAAPSPEQTSPAAANRAGVRVTVALAPELKEALDPAATVFVFATPPDGSPMPVAAVKRRVSELPLQLELSDADAMAPVARISNHAQVQIGARISLSGNAMPSSGDLVAEMKTAEVGAEQVTELLIDRRMP